MNELQYKLIKSSEPYLAHYNHNHSKVNGQFISGPGGPKVEKRREKIAGIEAELNDPRNKKKLAKYAKFNDKVAKANRKAEKARRKLEKGKKLSDRDLRKLTKYGKLKTKQIKIQAKETDLKAHLADLESKKAKLEKKNEKDISKAWERDLKELEEMERADKAMEEHGSKNLEWNLSPEEAKHFITDNEFSTFEKNPKTKSIKDVSILDGTTHTSNGEYRSISIEGTSTNRVWKSETKSTKNGVHLIEEHPQIVNFEDVQHESGAGIDKRKVQQLDSFARSKEVSDALREGRKMGPANASYSNKKQSASDWSPAEVYYGFSNKGEPVIISADYYHKDVRQDDHILTVYFDENHKPHGSSYDG